MIPGDGVQPQVIPTVSQDGVQPHIISTDSVEGQIITGQSQVIPTDGIQQLMITGTGDGVQPQMIAADPHRWCTATGGPDWCGTATNNPQ